LTQGCAVAASYVNHWSTAQSFPLSRLQRDRQRLTETQL
jgi:hypothetical protein